MEYLKKILSRRMLVAVLAATIMCSISLGAAATFSSGDNAPKTPKVIFNGSVLRMEDDNGKRLEPVMIDGKMYLPADGVANLLGIQHQELEENISVWYDPTVQTRFSSEKDGLLVGHRIKLTPSSVLVTMAHNIDQTVSMTAIESAHAFNTMWIQIPDGRTGTMAIAVGNTGKGNVIENRAGKLISSSNTVTKILVDYNNTNDVTTEGLQKAEENDQLEEAENEWNGMPLMVKVYNDETSELLAESRLEKGHQAEILVVEITGVKTLRLEAHPDIEGWKEARAGEAEE